ncbi:carboxypeptidase regulatory-like domain-containing protein [Polymorphospora rubra]|uniref:carboxypeptidase regulatory-like domain-containing protein n=1 Tax=Polymorphospora rubra TaxID=338584 RepID=UPI00340DAFC3
MVAALLVASPVSAEPAAPASPACVDEQPDVRNAEAMVAICQGPVEILAERTEVSQTFLNPDGSRTLEESLAPVRVRRGSSWEPVNTTLKITPAGIAPKASVLPVFLSPGGDGPLARVVDGDRELAMSWPDPLPKPELIGDTAMYREVLPDTDLRVSAHALGFSEVLVVRTPEAAKNPRLSEIRFGMSVKGLTVREGDGGTLVAHDDRGAAVFTAPAPLMWDSSVDADLPGDQSKPDSPLGAGKPTGKKDPGTPTSRKDAEANTADLAAREPAEGARRAVMPVRVGSDSLTIVPDKGLLTSPTAKFPIYIDPAWTGNISGSSWTTVWSKYKTSSFWKNATALSNGSTNGSAGAGRTADCTGCGEYIIRSFFRMDVSGVKGKIIQAATFRIEQRHSWTCSPKSNAKLWLTGAISASTTWNNQPTWNGSYTAQTAANRKVGAIHGCSGAGTIEFNVTSMVKKVAEVEKQSTMTVGLRAVDESTKNQWKRFNHSSPKLAITYNTLPAAPADRLSDGKACATGSSRPYVLTLTPTLAARQSDPDSGQQSLTTWFHWWPLGSSRNDTDRVSQASGNTAIVSHAIPAGRLVDGGTYVWQSRTYDGTHYGDWSGTCEFTVDATPPATPSNVTSTDYPTGATPHGSVGIAGTFEITAPTVRSYEVKEYAWTLDSGVYLGAARVAARSGDNGATITVKPVRDGIQTLRVWSKDHAGRYSATPRTYTFVVRAGAGPAAHWTFDEASGSATDVTQHGNDLSLAGGASRTTGRSGVGSALSVNGTSGHGALSGPVHYPHPDTNVSTAMRTDSSFTVAARVRLDSTSGVTGQRTIVSANGTRAFAYTLGYSGPDNRWRFTMAGTDADSPTLFTVLSNAAPTAGKWTHLAGVFDASTNTMRLYVNGVAQTAGATLSGGFNAVANVTVGKRKWAGGDDGFFACAIDDVRIYNFAETAAKLAELAVPLPAVISFPNGTEANAGGQLTATFDAGGDTNVTKFRYSVGSAGVDTEVAATGPGGTATVAINAGSVTGERSLFAVAVDDGNRLSGLAQASFTVTAATSLSGMVMNDADFTPLVGAVVTLEPGGYQTTSDASGAYSFTGMAPGTYTLVASYGDRCGLTASATITITAGSPRWRDLYLTPYMDDSGYTCALETRSFTSANETVLTLSGDDAVTEVQLPFAFPFYGQAYLSGWVDTNGYLSFIDPAGSHPNTGGTWPLPAAPNALIAPFWDDLVVDGAASVRTAAMGSGTAERFIVEWRNVHRKGNTAQRLSFEVILAPDGTVVTNYAGLTSDPLRGEYAAVGIEAPDGEIGLAYSVSEPVLTSGEAITFVHPQEDGTLELHDLSGVLRDENDNPVVGATVTLDPRGLSTTTGPGGAYSFDDLVADSYTVSARVGARCGRVASDQVELDDDRTVTLRLGPDYGTMGYACTVGSSGYVAASNVVALTGDDAWRSLSLPFSFAYHGRPYSTAWLHTNGLINFGAEPGDVNQIWVNPTMPTAAIPNGVIAPFWDDLNVDSSASVRTELLGSAPDRRFVVEWRNVLMQGVAAPNNRLTFELVLHEDGRIGFHYGTLTTPVQQGGGATVGLESTERAEVAALYSFQTAVVPSNGSIVYTPNTAGTVSGTLTTAVTGDPVAGRTVTLTPSGATTTTTGDGSYEFTGVPIGEYVVTAETGDDRCAGQYAREAFNHAGAAAVRIDLSVMIDGDEFGYGCTTGPQSFVAGNVVEAWSGDDEVWQKNPPFPIKLYGESYTSAWISANGVMTFRNPAFHGWIWANSTPIPSPPSEGRPNAAVYVHWNDWIVDSAARIATGTSGTAPNRKWVVEWRNVHLYGDTSARASFSAVFDENGDVTFTYADINPSHLRERGSQATVGIENGSGTIAFQHSHKEAVLTSGQGIFYKPNPPGSGTVTGTVTCQGTPVTGATVAMAGQSVTTTAGGGYEFDDVPAGTYAVIATLGTGACTGSAVTPVTVGTNTTSVVNFARDATLAGTGHTVVEQPVSFIPANSTVLSLTGDDAYTSITLPFPVTHYGQTYTTAWVDINGLLTFVEPVASSPDAWPIPSSSDSRLPKAAIYPMWHDWIVDADASIRTATLGSTPNRRFIVEWRNVRSYEDPTTRISFEVIIDESGGYTFAYTDNDGTNIEQGGASTIGIDNADGTAATRYTYRQPVLHPGTGLRIEPTS